MFPFAFLRSFSKLVGWDIQSRQAVPTASNLQETAGSSQVTAIDPTQSLLALIANAHKLAAAYGAPKAVLATLADPLRASESQIAQFGRYVADESKMLQAESNPDPLVMPAAMRASGGSMSDFKDAADLVGGVTRAQTLGQAIGLVLAYRKRVRTACLTEVTLPSDGDDYELAAASCWCRACNRDRTVGGLPYEVTTFIMCPRCGNKRCPHASDHKYACTKSNEPNQPGSVYS